VTGGGAKSPIWLQILADVLNSELVTVSSKEGAAYGASLLAATGAGVYEDVPTACKDAISITGRTFPGENLSGYQGLYLIYHQLYPILKSTFADLSDSGSNLT